MTEAVLEETSFIYKMLMTLIIAIACVGIVSTIVKFDLNTIDIQRELVFNRVLYDPQGFLYTDKDGVTHTAVIDRERFDTIDVDATFTYLPNYAGVKVDLIIDGDTKTRIINSMTYDNIRLATEANIKDGGSLVKRAYPVIVMDNGKRTSGWLNITVAVPARA